MTAPATRLILIIEPDGTHHDMVYRAADLRRAYTAEELARLATGRAVVRNGVEHVDAEAWADRASPRKRRFDWRIEAQAAGESALFCVAAYIIIWGVLLL